MSNPFYVLENHILINQSYLEKFIHKGDTVIDATCGNGNDTLFLRNLVGEKGKVIALDVQDSALDKTKKLIHENIDSVNNVEIIKKSHEDLSSFQKESPKAIVYNLGYLPQSNKETITKAETTIKSLNSALEILISGGVLSVLAYKGHDSGKENESVFKFFESCDPLKYSVIHLEFINRFNAPAIYILEKK